MGKHLQLEDSNTGRYMYDIENLKTIELFGGDQETTIRTLPSSRRRSLELSFSWDAWRKIIQSKWVDRGFEKKTVFSWIFESQSIRKEKLWLVRAKPFGAIS